MCELHTSSCTFTVPVHSWIISGMIQSLWKSVGFFALTPVDHSQYQVVVGCWSLSVLSGATKGSMWYLACTTWKLLLCYIAQGCKKNHWQNRVRVFISWSTKAYPHRYTNMGVLMARRPVCLAWKASVASQTVHAKIVNGPFPQKLTFGTHARKF